MMSRSAVTLSATLLLWCLIGSASAAPRRSRRDVEPEQEDVKEDLSSRESRQFGAWRRNDKSFPYYEFIPPAYLEQAIAYPYPPVLDNDLLARTDPLDLEPMLRSRYPDSPIYYIRLPPSPYVFVPGMGYVSQPPPPPTPPQINPFINLPIDFVSNGKPTGIYQWSGAPEFPQYPTKPAQPKPDSSVHTLNKGPYVFNGRPSDVYVLRDSVNTLYSDVLQNFYP